MTIPLDSLRGLQGRFLPSLAAVARYTETATADGTEQTWSMIASNVPCRVSPLAAAAIEALAGAGGITAVSQWTIWLPAATDVTERDRITVAPPDSRTFEVSRVGIRSYETARECICRLVT